MDDTGSGCVPAGNTFINIAKFRIVAGLFGARLELQEGATVPLTFSGLATPIDVANASSATAPDTSSTLNAQPGSVPLIVHNCLRSSTKKA